MKLCTAIFMAVFCLLLTTPLEAQRTLTYNVTDTENFNSFGTGTVNVTNNSTINGFYATRSTSNATPNPFVAGNGSANTGQFYNFGTTAAADRAAGTLATGATGVMYLGLRYANTASLPIASITVTYTGEQWRDGNGGETLAFSFRTGTTVTDLTTGTWTAVPALNFVATNSPGTGALDGNAAANRQVLTANVQVNIPVGGEVMLRWQDNNEGGQSTGFGIDDVSVSIIAVSAGESSISGSVTTAGGSGIRDAFVTVQGGDLEAPKTVATSRSGEFTLDGLTVGQTYFVSVNARKHTFAEPVQTLNLTDNSERMHFRALR